MTFKYSHNCEKMQSSAIREILAMLTKRDMISFGGGYPAEEFFPKEELELCWRRTMEENAGKALQYSQTDGIPQLRRTLAEYLGGGTEEDEILITTGSQQALYLLGQVFADHRARIVTERPTYLGALQAWAPLEPEIIPVPMDGKGLDVAELRRRDLDEIRFIYVVPTYHNPAGESMPDERRRELVEFARAKDAFIVEDDPYHVLRYEGPAYTPFYGIAPDITVSLGTFSKMMCPGMRTAWVRAPIEVRRHLSTAKQAVDLCSPALNQFLAHEFIKNGFVEKHAARMVPVYDARRKCMMAGLDAILPQGASYVRPQGGMFVWVSLPAGWDPKELLKVCIDKGVAFVPGDSFYLRGKGPPAMRLNFSKENEEKIEKGLGLLDEGIKEYRRGL